ncbi:MAG: ATP-binding protein [Leptolyngbyaceae bacterium]|nr:ATP-binding protein [Leptolyngbyaceae bacterium]
MTPDQFLEFARLLPEPMLLITGNGQILAANPSLFQMLGLQHQMLQGKMLFELVTNPPEQVKQYLRNCSSTREMVLGTLTLSIHPGETCLYRCEGAAIRPWSSESPALIVLRLNTRESASSRFTVLNEKINELSKEIRRRQQLEEERAQLLLQEQKARAEAEKARAEAENLNRLKDEFLLTVSHELRTPLNAIQGWSHILRRKKVGDTEMHRALETIERNAKSQAQLIDDLLDISSIITGKFRLNAQEVELLSVIEAAMDSVRPAAAAKNIRLQLVLDPTAGLVLGDPERLQQIIWNLLSNAIKFTPKQGQIEVSLQRINSHIEIAVEDTGRGISAEFLPYVFDRFRQADSSITRSIGGLGLGLAIVRQLVELHGGTVHAESPGEGQGATFTVKLPMMAFQSKGVELERVHSAVGGNVLLDDSPRLDGLKILVVDDDGDSRDLLTFTLEACGAHVRTAASAKEAISILREASTPLDVLISDIGMPDEDGYTLLRRVRSLKPDEKAEIPVIALTAYVNRRAALLAGFQAHVAKPVEPSELIAVIATMVG